MLMNNFPTPARAYQAPCINVLTVNMKNYACLAASVDSFVEEEYEF